MSSSKPASGSSSSSVAVERKSSAPAAVSVSPPAAPGVIVTAANLSVVVSAPTPRPEENEDETSRRPRFSSNNGQDEGMIGSSLEDQMTSLEEKVKRTSKLLHEIQDLGPAVQEREQQEDLKERQAFIRRILQVSAELQDCRDIIHQVCDWEVSIDQLEEHV